MESIGLTNEDFKYFCQCLEYWQEKLGCFDVSVIPEFKNLEDKEGLAEYARYEDCGTLIVRLNKEIEKDFNIDLDRMAFHEIFEGIYLSDLRHMAQQTYSDWKVDRATHAAVKRAENTIYKAMKNEKTILQRLRS
jgi:hypothetical protein